MQLSDHTLTALFAYSLKKYDDAPFLSYVDGPRIAGDYLASLRKTVNSRLNVFSRSSGESQIGRSSGNRSGIQGGRDS